MFFTTKSQHQGTGMGLAISQKIISEMGGTIECGTQVGLGTTFTLTFSSTTDDPLKEKLDTIAFKELKGHCLVIEDDENIRDLLRYQIENFGLTVDEAKDGIDGFEKIKNGTYDLIITDLQIPKMRGEELIQKVRKLKISQPKIIVVTGGIVTGYTKSERDSLRQLADGYIKKPFSSTDLYNELNKLNIVRPGSK